MSPMYESLSKGNKLCVNQVAMFVPFSSGIVSMQLAMTKTEQKTMTN